MLWGLGRTLALEHPEIWGGIVDVDESVPAGLAARYVVDEAHGGDGEDQVVYRAGIRRVPRLQSRHLPSASPAELDNDSSYLVIGATGNIGPHLIRQLADSGAGTVVAVSRNPGSRLDELAASLSATGTTLVTVAADAADETAMSALFDRFGADLPPLGGIYVAAFAGGPITLRDMTNDDVTAMFRPKLDVVALLHKLSSAPSGAPVCAVLVDLRGDRLALAGPLRGHHNVPGHVRVRPSRRRTSGYCDQLGALEIVVGQPVRRGTTCHSGFGSRTDARRGRHPGAAVGHRSRHPGTLHHRRGRLGAARHRLPKHPRGAAHRGRPAADGDRGGQVIDADHRVPGSVAGRRAGAAARPAGRSRRLPRSLRRWGWRRAQLLDPLTGFFQSGMDSLMSVTLQRALSDSLGESLPASVVFDYPTVEALADYLATILPELVEVSRTASRRKKWGRL